MSYRTDFKKYLRTIYRNYVELRIPFYRDSRKRGYQKPIVKELKRNLRLLRNNYKGITDKIYDLIHNSKDNTIIAIKLNSIYDKCSYYLILEKNRKWRRNIYIEYMNINKLIRELNNRYNKTDLFVYPFSNIATSIMSYF